MRSTWLKPRTSSRRRARLAVAEEVGGLLRQRDRARRLASEIRGETRAWRRAPRARQPCPTRRGRRLRLHLLVQEVAAHRVARAVTLPLENTTWKRCARRASGTSRRSRRDTRARCAGSARRSASGRARGSCPSSGRSARPHVQRERVVAAQVLDVEHFQARLLHLDDHVGEARDPAAGEHVLADEEIGVEAPDVADEVDEPDAALFR